MPRTLKSIATKKNTRGRRIRSTAPAPRAKAAADAVGSVRAEGLDPGRAEPLLAAWARGELSDEQLEQARLQLLRDRSLSAEKLLADTRAA